MPYAYCIPCHCHGGRSASPWRKNGSATGTAEIWRGTGCATVLLTGTGESAGPHVWGTWIGVPGPNCLIACDCPCQTDLHDRRPVWVELCRVYQQWYAGQRNPS